MPKNFLATPSQPDIKDIKLELQTSPEKSLTNGVETSANTAQIQPTPVPGTVPVLPATNGTETALPVAATAEEVKERCPPKAMVKPQVLTHVIEDFVIQESSEPFPITRNSLLGDLKGSASPNEKDLDEPPRKKHAGSPLNNSVGMSAKGELAKCEACGTVDLRAKFKKNKRFCSVACSKKLVSNLLFLFFEMGFHKVNILFETPFRRIKYYPSIRNSLVYN